MKIKVGSCPFCGGTLMDHELGDYRGVACKCEKCELVIEGFWSDSATSFAEKVNARADEARFREGARTEYERWDGDSVGSLPPDFAILVIEAMAEAQKAMRKFPQPNYVISKFAEEAGEVVKAAIHHAENRETRDAVVGEMRQALAMMLRLWIEGDQVHGMKPLTQEGR